MNVSITSKPIDPAELREDLRAVSRGACVLFEGWVRDHNEGRRVERLEYEVYEPLAVREGQAVLAEAAARWEIGHALCVHRSGLLEPGDIAVVVGVASAHRDDAFRAARYIIDEIKVRLPIWKKEHYADGEAHWVNCRRCGDAAPDSEHAA